MPLTDDRVIADCVEPALRLLPPAMDSLESRVLLLAIGLQESRFQSRYQLVPGQPGAKGPARGFWQFERGGGCAGVLRHSASRYWMHAVCAARSCAPLPNALWLAIEEDDVLAAADARLLLFADPKRLPVIGQPWQAWELYLRTWRPGKPHPGTWAALYQRAVVAVTGGTPAPRRRAPSPPQDDGELRRAWQQALDEGGL